VLSSTDQGDRCTATTERRRLVHARCRCSSSTCPTAARMPSASVAARLCICKPWSPLVPRCQSLNTEDILKAEDRTDGAKERNGPGGVLTI
jgi:hypothetical protein